MGRLVPCPKQDFLIEYKMGQAERTTPTARRSGGTHEK
jgi:hypothetical protein